VVAEGVEHLAQLSFLQSFGSDHYQGFLHSKPLPSAEFEQLLRAGMPQPGLAAASA